MTTTIPRVLTETRCACGTTRRTDRLGRTMYHAGMGEIVPLIDARDKCPVCNTFAKDHDYIEGGEGRCLDCDGRWHSHRISHPDVPLLHDPEPGGCVCGQEIRGENEAGGWWRHVELLRETLIENEAKVMLAEREARERKAKADEIRARFLPGVK